MRGMYNLDSNTSYSIRKDCERGRTQWGGGYALNGVPALTHISVDFWGAFGQLYLFLGWGVSNITD